MVTSGSRCEWDVPGAGMLNFEVQQVVPDHSRTDDGGGLDAYATISSNEIVLVFEVPAARSTARFDCDATRR